MKNYYKDKTALEIPWVESPFAKEILKSHASMYSEEEYKLLEHFIDFGYVTIDLGLADSFINDLNYSIVLAADKAKTQEGGYHYSNSPRIFEAWKKNLLVLNLCKNEKILSTLRLLYERTPVPFQTINFIRGTNQPLHQDSIHFYTQPERWMSGVWCALEDMTEENGALTIVPGSHSLPFVDFQFLNLPVCKYGQQFENYSEYENYIQQLCRLLDLKEIKWLGKRGQAIIWAANLLHGGSKIINTTATRYSQAIHYYYEGCNHYYSPLFSDIRKGLYADKNLSEKDILNHKLFNNED